MAQNSGKPAIFLLDAMSFIFRAYHAMQRQRPMSTRTGIPTAATYVFVNMINKLRRDFSPEFFAAVFDPAGPVFRDERARFRCRHTPGGKNCPQVDGGQGPVSQDGLHRAVREFRREHPFRCDSKAHVSEHCRAHAFSRVHADSAGQGHG